MEKIGSFLERFKDIAIPDEAIRNNLSDIILSLTGEKINFRNISIKDGVARIVCSPSIKSEIFIQKARILKEIQEQKDIKSPIIDIK